MYRIFNISLECDIPLPELSEGNGTETIINIQLGPKNYRETHQPDWFHEWKDINDEICIMIAHIGDDYLLRFPDLGDFLIASSYKKILYFPEPNVPQETIRHLLLDQVIPRILGHKGQLVLHASAIQLPDGTGLVFLGDTGWGKSTIASSYYENGARLISDDCLLIRVIQNSVYCIPNYFGLRLYPDSSSAVFKEDRQFEPVAHYTSKKRLKLSNTHNCLVEPIPVSTIFLLSDPDKDRADEIFIQKINGADELMTIIAQTFLLDVTDKQLIERQFRNASKVVETVPAIFKLNYPRKHSMLPEVRKTIENAVTETGAIC